MQVQKS